MPLCVVYQRRCQPSSGGGTWPLAVGKVVSVTQIGLRGSWCAFSTRLFRRTAAMTKPGLPVKMLMLATSNAPRQAARESRQFDQPVLNLFETRGRKLEPVSKIAE